MADDWIEQQRNGSLCGGWLTKYQHIERLGHRDCDGLLYGEVFVQNKMDGANLTIACKPDSDEIIIASRNQVVSNGGHPANGFNGAIEYVLDNPHLCRLAREGYILRGEWAVRHSLNYAPETYRHFYLFDVQRRDDLSYLHFDQYHALIEGTGIRYVPVFKRLINPSIDELTPLMVGPDDWGAAQKEGIVVKNYGFKSKHGHVVWAKLVSADFKEKNKLEFGATKYDPVELKYASLLTQEDVLKVIHRVGDEKGTGPEIRHMSEVLGRVWSDHWDDRLWQFVKKEKVRIFDFSAAQKLITTKTREVALAFYNGTLVTNEVRAEVAPKETTCESV